MSFAIRCDSDPEHPVARFALAQLAAYLVRSKHGPDAPSLMNLAVVAEQDAEHPVHDGYRIERDGETLHLRATQPRGLLNGVYGILTALGFAFPYPGFDRCPETADWPALLALGDAGQWRIPSFRHRIFHFDNMRLSPEMIDWSGKLCINMIQEPLHLFNRDIAVRPVLLHMIRERGIELNVGGHGFNNWIPPLVYQEEHPEWWAAYHAGAGRAGLTDDENACREHATGQLCLSNREVVKEFAANIVAFLKKHPDVRTVCLWPNDMPGGWCTCPSCLALEPDPDRIDSQADAPSRSASYMWFIGQVGPLVHAEVPEAKIECCAFYEYATPPLNVDVVPTDDYYLGFLLDDYFGCLVHGHGQACNRPRIEAAHHQWRAVFPGEIYAIGYYADLCKLMDCPFVYTTKIKEDFTYLKDDIGIDSINTLIVFAGIDYLLQFTFASLYSYAALSWNHLRTSGDVLRELARGISPAGVEAVYEYLATWDRLGAENPDKHAGWIWMDFEPPEGLWASVTQFRRIRDFVSQPMVDRLSRHLAEADSATGRDAVARAVLRRMARAFSIFQKLYAYDPNLPAAEQEHILRDVAAIVLERGTALNERGGPLPAPMRPMLKALRDRAAKA